MQHLHSLRLPGAYQMADSLLQLLWRLSLVLRHRMCILCLNLQALPRGTQEAKKVYHVDLRLKMGWEIEIWNQFVAKVCCWGVMATFPHFLVKNKVHFFWTFSMFRIVLDTFAPGKAPRDPPPLPPNFLIRQVLSNPWEKLRSCIFWTASHFYAQNQHRVLFSIHAYPLDDPRWKAQAAWGQWLVWHWWLNTLASLKSNTIRRRYSAFSKNGVLL